MFHHEKSSNLLFEYSITGELDRCDTPRYWALTTEQANANDQSAQTLPVVHVTYQFADGTLYQSFDLQFEKGAIADDFLYYEVQGNGLDTIQRVVEKTTANQATQTTSETTDNGTQTDSPVTSDNGTQTDSPVTTTTDSGKQMESPATTDNDTQSEQPSTVQTEMQTAESEKEEIVEKPEKDDKQQKKVNVKKNSKNDLPFQAKVSKKENHKHTSQNQASSDNQLPKTGSQADQALLLSGLASIGLATGILLKRKKEQ